MRFDDEDPAPQEAEGVGWIMVVVAITAFGISVAQCTGHA